MTDNELWLGDRCFLVKASNLPAGTNRRPGVTLLLARRGRLALEVGGERLSGLSFLLSPDVARRFSHPQPHFSLTLEPGHWAYCSYLRWARDCAQGSRASANRLGVLAAAAPALETLEQAAALDAWLLAALRSARRETVPMNDQLVSLLAMIDDTPPPSAEEVWTHFRAQHPGSQSHWSRWLQRELGVSLRKVLVGRKLRQAMNQMRSGANATAIAHDVGFSDSSHLSRLTARTFGIGPRQAQNRKILQVSDLRGPRS